MKQQLIAAFKAGELAGLHSVYVARGDEVLTELYLPGADQRWGTPLGVRQHAAGALHDLRSVTKSIVGLLYGIALDQGLVAPPEAPLIAQFPEHADLAADPARAAIRVHHALAMTMGMEWSEDLPYSDPRNGEIAMENAPDRHRFVLDRPMVNPPGTQWTYSGGATALVARLIAQGTTQALDEYASDTLFKPLGIKRSEWVRGTDGIPSAASGLRLQARDLAKVGRMIADGGIYAGQQVVPADWLAASFRPAATLPDGIRYGYYWWLAPEAAPSPWVAGFGNGGQRLVIDPRDGTVIVIFAGNYNQPDAWQLPLKIITPALQANA